MSTVERNLTLDGLAVALRVLRLLAADYGHLPAPAVDVSTVFPERLTLSFHDDPYSGGCEAFAAFEQWRTVLGIGTDAVGFRSQCGGRTWVLRAEGVFGGAVVVLAAYVDQPATDRGAAGGAV
ncbi:hypothetical protein AB0M23_28050 [Streptomyces sp. NPDC052077]|uniref:hypothetical protein n=1 Tax=Streptomyces sp. NPDC052077 TaxID=3154757 RepID=UPI0034304121